MLDLNAIEQRANAATPGPWWQDGANCLPWEVSPSVFEFAGKRIRVFPTGENENEMDCIADAKFIAHARADIPALIARVRELEAIIEATAREHECVAINANVWVHTKDSNAEGKPWVIRRNNEPIGDADTLWDAIAKGLADDNTKEPK